MVKFEYKDITIEFQSWYDAASWLYYQWNELDNEKICHMIDSSTSYFYDFMAWVNDTYLAYDILTRHNDNLYEDLFEKYLEYLADDLADDTYDFCVYFTEVEEEKPQPDPNLKYYRITYSCGCGESEEYIIAADYTEAEKYAYEMAVEDYHSFEGLHGVRTLEEIAEEMFGGNWDDEEEEEPEFDITFLTRDQFAEAQDAYYDEIESTIYWSAEEISFEEYLDNGGRVF